MINRFSILNFKAFSNLQVDFADITLLTGLNGAGKSTVLQALSLIRQSHESRALEHGVVSLNGKYVQIGSGRDALCESASDLVVDGTPQLQFRIETLNETCVLTARYEPESDFLVADTRGDIENTPLGASEYQHIRADRVGPEVLSSHSYLETVRQRSVGARGEFAVDRLVADSDQQVNSRRMHEGESRRTLIDQVNAWMSDTCPGITLQSHTVPNSDSVRLDVGFGGTSGLNSSNRFRPTNVGFGVAYALPIIVACLTAQRGSIVAIENPEAHLHPRGQSRIAALCAAAAADGVQMLVESHSDHFLNGLRLSAKNGDDFIARVYYFDRQLDAGFRRIDVDDNGMLSDWPAGFFDESSILLSKIVRPKP